MVKISFIKKIVDKAVDEKTHMKFVRFSVGTYTREAMTIKLGKRISFKSGYEYADDVLSFVVSKLSEPTKVSGAIISRKGDLSELFTGFGIKFGSRGKKYSFTHEFEPEDLKSFLEAAQENYLIINFKSSEYKLKMKKSLPKPGSLAEDFLSAELLLSDLDYVKENYLFDCDCGKFKKAVVRNTYVIEDIQIPKEFESDLSLARIKAIRKGKLVRDFDVDGKISKKEYEFEA